MTVVATAPTITNRLYVAWQDDATRGYHPVAMLTDTEDGYVFQYLKTATTLPHFQPFLSFPDLHRVYRSDRLFAFFANRLMSPRRSDYPQFLDDLGLTHAAGPLDMLARLGARATDSIEVFAAPVVADGEMSASFFVRGVRYLPGAEEVIEALAPGDPLRLLDDPENEVNPAALHVARADRPIGWLPQYLVDPVRRALDTRDPAVVKVRVAQVNPRPTPRQVRLRCRLSVPLPAGFLPFDGPEFLELVPA